MARSGHILLKLLATRSLPGNSSREDSLLPVWFGVTKEQASDYSSILVSRVAVNRSFGEEAVVAHQLIRLIR